jgi:hypothetical protein
MMPEIVESFKDKKDKRNLYALLGVALFMLMLGIFMTSMASAENTGCQKIDIPAAMGKYIPFTQYCGNCSYVKIGSVTYPNGTVQTLNIATSNRGNTTYVNDTAVVAQTTGTYNYETFGDPSGSIVRQCLSIDVTSTGDKGVWIFFLFAGTGIVLFAFAYIYKDAYLGLFSSFAFILLGIYSLPYGIGTMNNQFTQTLSYIFIGLGLIFGFASVGEMYFEWKDEGDSD